MNKWYIHSYNSYYSYYSLKRHKEAIDLDLVKYKGKFYIKDTVVYYKYLDDLNKHLKICNYLTKTKLKI